MAKGVNIPLTISGLREAREDLAKLDKQLEGVDKRTKEGKALSKQFNDLSEAVDETTESLKEMNAAGELAGTKFDDLNEVLFQTNEEVLPLTSQIGEMEDRMYQLAQANQQGSKEFIALQQKVVAARKTIIETDRSIDLMTENTGSLGGLTSAFGELGDSVLSLDFKRMGQSVKGLGVQFKAFGRVLLANPLFLIVAIVAAIVGAIIAFKDKVKFLSDIFEALGAVIDIVIQAFKDLLDFLGLTNFAEQDLAEERKKRAEENIANIERQSKAEQAAFDRKIALASAEGKSTTELEIAKQKAIIETNKARANELKIIAEQEKILGNLTKDRVNEIIAQANEITENLRNAKNQIKIIETNAAKEARARAKERKDLKDKELAEDKKRIDELNAYIRQAELDRLAQEEELAEVIYQAGLTQQEREITAVNDKYFNLIESAKQFGLDTQALEIEQQEALAKINKTYADAEEARKKALEDKEKAARKKEIEDEQKLQEAKLSLVSSGLNVVGQLTDAFGKKNEAAAKRAFQIQKAISIAQAVIDTYKGANAIFASAAANPQSILFPAQPFITAGIAIAAGIANVAKIAQTKFEGSSTPSASSPSAPSLGGGGGTSASTSTPSFELFGQPNEDNNVSAAQAQELTPTVVKAVVVESDITTTQNKVSKMKENAEL